MASLTYQDYQGSGANNTTYTFSSMGIGTADADRKVLAVIGGFDSSGADPTSVTIGGVSASLVAGSTFSDLDANVCLYEASIPTGTTADVVVSYSPTQTRVSCATYSAKGLSMTPFDSGTDEDNGGSSLSVSVNRSIGGYVLAGCWSTNSTDISWTNVTEDLTPQQPEPSSLFTIGSAESVTGGSVTVTATITGSVNKDALLVISFESSEVEEDTSRFFMMM